MPSLIVIVPIFLGLGANIIHLLNKIFIFAHGRFIPEFPLLDAFFEPPRILKFFHEFRMHLDKLQLEVLDLMLSGISGARARVAQRIVIAKIRHNDFIFKPSAAPKVSKGRLLLKI